MQLTLTPSAVIAFDVPDKSLQSNSGLGGGGFPPKCSMMDFQCNRVEERGRHRKNNHSSGPKPNVNIGH
ncbi:hypothetical protein CEXT_240881 [Caerostris extrusa]|uniref:Uncharacterized protein n=1 Tax=Caerostris extrusa TaxID=172846 RepID=A0AAV4XD33_CAEEX|nr:hypothetical protein CEXT_240881 [Caerostris extrusa]